MAETVETSSKEEPKEQAPSPSATLTQNRKTLYDYLNSPFSLALLTGLVITGLGGLYTNVRQSEAAKEAAIVNARKLLNESRYRLNEVINTTDELNDSPDPDKKQMFSRFIYQAEVGDSFTPSQPEFKGRSWAGIISELDSLEHVDGFKEAMRSAQDFKSGFYNHGFNYFDSTYLSDHIKTLDAYHDRVAAKIDNDEASRSWFERKFL